ncbi:MAG: hypothetical protein AAF215_19305 [Cyanobacteria bacterium P01_A01_bin.123]
MTNVPESRLDRLEALAETTLLAIQQQQGQINELREGIGEVVSMFSQQAVQVAEMQSEIRGLQVENRRILDHLFGQQGEG